MTLAAIGGHYSFTRSDLDGLTASDLRFWAGAMAEYIKRTKPKGGP